MIPDKEGWYWYEDENGERSVCFVGLHPIKKLGLRASTIWSDGNYPLDHPQFTKWLGSVNPEPMKASGE